MLFDNLFAWVGPFGSALALLALVIACFAVAAAETARVAQLDRVAARQLARARRWALTWRDKQRGMSRWAVSKLNGRRLFGR